MARFVDEPPLRYDTRNVDEDLSLRIGDAQCPPGRMMPLNSLQDNAQCIRIQGAVEFTTLRDDQQEIELGSEVA
jgi:hypothetical protein